MTGDVSEQRIERLPCPATRRDLIEWIQQHASGDYLRLYEPVLRQMRLDDLMALASYARDVDVESCALCGERPAQHYFLIPNEMGVCSNCRDVMRMEAEV